LTRALSNLEDVEVSLFGHDSVGDHVPGTTVASDYLSFPSQPLGLLWEQVVLPRLAKRHDVDVLLCPNDNGPVFPISVPVVVCQHDVFGYQGYHSKFYGMLQRRRVPRMLDAADAIVTVSEFSKREIANELSISPQKVGVVYNGVDDLFLKDGNAEPVDVDEPYLLFVGAMNDRKNFSGLLRAYSILRERYGDEHGLAVAGPEDRFIYKNVDSDLDREHIRHFGFVSEEELKYLYLNADLFLFPSLREGFGLPPLEAMACGTPVLSSDRPCMPEVLDDAAAFADATDPETFAAEADRILSNDSLAERLRRAGKRHAQSFTWDRAAEQLRDVLSETTRDGVSTREFDRVRN